MMKKRTTKVIALFVSAVSALSLAACADDTKPTECAEHSWDSGVISVAATCGNKGITKYTCTVCGKTKDERNIVATGDHQSGDSCSVCGYIDMSGLTKGIAIAEHGYYHVDNDESGTITTNDTVYFGSYPQTKITDSELCETLFSSLTSVWKSYGYYAEGEQNDGLMSYQDVTESGVKYRAVKIDGYRPFYTDLAATSANSIVYENGYRTDNIYWFRFEPIEWRVLDYDNGEAFLNTVDCIDSQSYNNVYDKKGAQYYNNETEIFSNDWENSYIRDFLNDSFYSWAFTAVEQGKIVEKTLDNKTTGYSATSNYAVSQNATTDKVYLLSYKDLFNQSYGFPDDVTKDNNNPTDKTVCKLGSDYALSQGARTSVQSPGSWWMLRSAGGKSFSVCGVTKYGSITNSANASYQAGTTNKTEGIAYNTSEGISPAINVKFGK